MISRAIYVALMGVMLGLAISAVGWLWLLSTHLERIGGVLP